LVPAYSGLSSDLFRAFINIILQDKIILRDNIFHSYASFAAKAIKANTLRYSDNVMAHYEEYE